MRSVVFVAPFGLASTMKFVRAAAALPDVRLGIISQESGASISSKLSVAERKHVEAFAQVGDSHDPDQLERTVRQTAAGLGGRVDVLLGILESLQEPLAEVRERLNIRGMDLAESRRFRDKAHMKETLRAKGLPCARHCLAKSAEEALAFARKELPLVAKPPDGAGAKDTFRVEEIGDLERWLRHVPPSYKRPLLLEEFIRGEEHSFDSVSIGGKHVFHSISRYAPTPLEVMESPWIQWTVLLPRSIDGPEYDAIRAAGPATLDALGMVTGMTHMEWFRRKDGTIAISEVAARPPGAQFTSLISYAHERDFYKVWAESLIFERFDPPQRIYSAGAAYLRGRGTGVVTSLAGVEELQRELGDLVIESKLPQVGQPKASSYEGEGYVILRHPDTEVVAEGLRRIVSTLQVELGAAHGGKA